MEDVNLIEGETLRIQSYKHNGHIHRVWSETLILYGDDNIIIGGNDHTLVTESDRRTWVTREPAIVYFHSEYWFNVICMFRDDGVYYYCNLSSPFIYDGEAIKYIDYDLDIKVYPDGKYHLLDEDEYKLHKQRMRYSDDIDYVVRKNVDILQSWIEEKKGPFAPDFIKVWHNKFIDIKTKQLR
ncbi:DUF402 domain-containing protein [Abyssicoccus albus]|uniref:DUF402 domain-containing protein n=1 Tax=Abyssicoccus albus TaxID=1817405 RepID=A0A1Q1G0E8_9BACL|nr:DUF402 domain-containing protein [Abyssicoccus albus]AQL55832.1 hypothetical protein BVH56_02185 [Abyssicoccus albus]RPF55136.1 hypothetical protein EDD62_1460 [Abyssicoccus albus]